MQFPANFNWKPMNILKVLGLVLAAIIVIVLAFRLIGSSFNALFPKTSTSISNMMRQSAPAMDSSEIYYGKGGVSYDASGSTASLSMRNVAAPSIAPAPDGATVGDSAEEFEVTEYSANIETRHLEDTCNKVVALKTREDVIFENANQYERGCNYTFKVKHKSVAEILAIVKALDPKELNENTYTIKRQVDDYTSEVDILQKKMASIEKTLADAIKAYEEVTKLAIRTQSVESLAKIIDSKVNIIERMTQERININAQLERLERAKAEQLDRLDYTYFSVNILEDKFVDGQNLKDSWKTAIKTFVRDVNKVAQDITINLVTLLLTIAQYVIYFLIVLFVAKYGWQLAKYIWRK